MYTNLLPYRLLFVGNCTSPTRRLSDLREPSYSVGYRPSDVILEPW